MLIAILSARSEFKTVTGTVAGIEFIPARIGVSTCTDVCLAVVE